MRILSFVGNKFKSCCLKLFKVRYRTPGIHVYALGIPICRFRNRAAEIYGEFKSDGSFDKREIDRKIDALLPPLDGPHPDIDEHRIAHLATKLYDMGGHTRVVRDTIKALADEYDQRLFLVQKDHTRRRHGDIYAELETSVDIEGVECDILAYEEKVRTLAGQILAYAPKALFAYIHPDDIFGAMVLSLIRKSSDIRILFFNHASHFPVLGMNFADVVLEGMPSTKAMTEGRRHCSPCRIVGLQSLAEGETVHHPRRQLDDLKRRMGVAEGSLLTMSGGAAYKFFDDGNDSKYFRMVARLLRKEKRLNHVVMSKFKRRQIETIERIFQGMTEERSRLIMVPFQKDFDPYFQCADVFVDSFPVSSALTQIDLMRNKVASIVKINTANPEWSFHEYQMPDYPYMFEKVEDMEQAVLDLLHHPDKRAEIIDRNYRFWLRKYERSAVKRCFKDIIDGHEAKDPTSAQP